MIVLACISGEASVPTRILQLAYSVPCVGNDECVLVLENRKRYGENLEQG